MRTQRLLAGAAVLVLAACAGTDPDGEGADVVTDAATESAAPTQSAAPTEGDAATESAAGDGAAGEMSTTEPDVDETDDPEEADGSDGTRENPLPIGTRVRIADHEVAVTEVVKDATQQNLDDNEFNQTPPDGTQYFLARLEGTYVGEDSGDPGFDLLWKLLGNAGNTFDPVWEPPEAPSDFFPSCTLDTMYEIGETFPGGDWSGVLCFLVPSDQVDGGAIIIEALSFADTDRTFWALD